MTVPVLSYKFRKNIESLINKWGDTLVVFFLVFLGGMIRFFRLGKQSLWIDELLQVVISAEDIPGIFAGIQYHLSPPLDYLLLHMTLSLGEGDFIARINAAIFGTLTLVAFFFFTKALFNRRIAILSSTLLVFSRYHIHYSQEARMYSLFCLLTVVSFYLLWLYSIRNEKIYYYLLLLVVDIALLYTHYYSIFVIFTHILYLGIIIITRENGDDNKDIFNQLLRIFSGFLIVGIFFLPWLGVFIKQINLNYYHGVIGSAVSQNHFYNIMRVLRVFSWPTVYNQIITHRFEDTFSTPWPSLFFQPFEMIFPVLALIGTHYYLKKKSKFKHSIAFLLLWFFLPLLLFIINNGIMDTRYYIFILPPYLIMVALGFTGLKSWLITKSNKKVATLTLLPIAILIASIVSMSLYDYFTLYNKDDWRSVGVFLEKNTEPNDTILVLGGNSSYLNYYFQGSSKIIDADYMYGGYASIENYEDLTTFVMNEECKWIFVSKHSNNIFGYNSKEIKESVRILLMENMDIVEEVYHQGGYDLPGLYRSLNCKPY